MPSKKIVCEFCQAPSTKQLVAGHIKSKHAHDVGKMLLQEWKDGENITPIKQYMDARPIRNMPVSSKLYDGAVYWFGVDARFFDEEDTYSIYIKSQENMDSHRSFIEECLRSISLMDFIECDRQYQLKCQVTMDLKREVHELQRKVVEDEKQFASEVDRRDMLIQKLRNEVEDLRQSSDNPDTIQGLQRGIKEHQTTLALQANQITRLKYELDTIEDKHEQSLAHLYDAHRVNRQEDEEMYRVLNQRYQALKVSHEKLQLNVKKEAQKIVDKQEKQREKDKEKARQAKEKLKEEILLAKLKARRTSPKQKKRYSSSESSSSSSSSESDDDE